MDYMLILAALAALSPTVRIDSRLAGAVRLLGLKHMTSLDGLVALTLQQLLHWPVCVPHVEDVVASQQPAVCGLPAACLIALFLFFLMHRVT
jgi:hypothetical protein